MFKFNINPGLVSSTLLLLTGCASGPDYQQPELPSGVDAAFINQPVNADSSTEPLPEWWRMYLDEALNRLVQQALAANTDLRVAEANLSRARAIYHETGSDRYPSTSLSGGASYGRDQTSWPGPDKAPKQWTYSGGLGVAYEVDLFGRVRRDVEAAEAELESAAAVRDAVRLAVVAETTRAYIDACTLGKSMVVAQNSVSLAERSLHLIRQREQSGAAMRLDVERAATSLARAEAALAPIQARRQNRLLELASLMGRTPAEMSVEAQQCDVVPELVGALPVGNGAQMLRRRPDVRAAERQLAASTARIGVSVASLYPQITVGANANYLRNDTLRGDRSWSFGIGPLISWHFPNQVAARARIQQAEAETAAALANFDGTVLTALKETEQALAQYKATLKQRSALAQARDYARNAYDLADQRYRAGAIGYLDVLVSQGVLIDAESALVASEQRLGSQRVSLFLALGGGWDNFEEANLSQGSILTEYTTDPLSSKPRSDTP
ncbi:MAG: transporter [Haliea sp.]|nr:transporter [Haliea sp.]MAM71866.1 transporter [Gammaproteobacteria bacterium]|tara:strand:- start:26162 stop:27655 length:1494 start_codon:yes stop_codon:yes gene_type:complete